MPYDRITACLMTSSVTLFPIKAVFWHTGFQNSAYEFWVRHTDQLITDERNTIVTTGSPIILNPHYIEDSRLCRLILFYNQGNQAKRDFLLISLIQSPRYLLTHGSTCLQNIKREVHLVIWSQWKCKIQVVNTTELCWMEFIVVRPSEGAGRCLSPRALPQRSVAPRLSWQVMPANRWFCPLRSFPTTSCCIPDNTRRPPSLWASPSAFWI